MNSLSGLYRRASAGDGSPVLDADLLARLAAGEHLGEEHDRVVAALAQSATAAASVRAALATAPASAWLEAELARAQGRARPHGFGRAVAHARGRRWQLAALAASAFLALALLMPRETPVTPAAPMAQSPAAGADDWILAGDFEGAPRPEEPTHGSKPGDEGIFIDDFGA